jgi:hypothetical protein
MGEENGPGRRYRSLISPLLRREADIDRGLSLVLKQLRLP